MEPAAVAAAAQAANQASMFGAALRMNMANGIAANLALNFTDRLESDTPIDDDEIDQVADVAVRLADAVMRRCQIRPDQLRAVKGH